MITYGMGLFLGEKRIKNIGCFFVVYICELSVCIYVQSSDEKNLILFE